MKKEYKVKAFWITIILILLGFIINGVNIIVTNTKVLTILDVISVITGGAFIVCLCIIGICIGIFLIVFSAKSIGYLYYRYIEDHSHEDSIYKSGLDEFLYDR